MRTRTSFKPGNTVGFKKGYDPNRNTTIPGPGAPKQVLRQKFTDDLSELREELKAKHRAGELDPLRYAEFLARYGLGTQTENKNETTVTHLQVTYDEESDEAA